MIAGIWNASVYKLWGLHSDGNLAGTTTDIGIIIYEVSLGYWKSDWSGWNLLRQRHNYPLCSFDYQFNVEFGVMVVSAKAAISLPSPAQPLNEVLDANVDDRRGYIFSRLFLAILTVQ